MSLQLRRIYAYSDAVMLSVAELICKFYKEYYGKFSDFDSQLFLEGYGNEFQEAITTGYKIERDSLVTDTVSQESADVEEAIENFLDHYDDLIYYVEKTFPNDPDIQKQFHHKKLSLIKRQPAEFVLWTEEVIQAIAINEQPLLGRGYKATSILQIQGAKNRIHTHFLEQQEAIKRRPEKTQERIAHFNLIWEKVLEVHDASARVFKNEPDTAILFALPKATKTKKSPEEPTTEPEQPINE